MPTLTELAKKAGKFVTDNSPAIMTAIGVTGTLATAYLTGRASIKAGKLIGYEEADNREYMTREQLKNFILEKKLWKLYIPAASTAAVTVSAIIFANRVGSRRAAAMATAFTLTEKAFEEYKAKVVERLGESKETAIRDEIAQDRVNRSPVPEGQMVVIESGKVLCYEPYTDRYFQSSMEDLRQAQNDINLQVLHDGFAALGDFYEKIGLGKTSLSDELGWTPDVPLDLKFSSVISSTGKPALSFEYRNIPIR